MPEPHYDTSAPVLVTGATGYIAGWLVRRLLETGFTVHAAVRDPDRADKVSHLKAMERRFPGTIRFFQSDLLVDGSYTEAMTGCRVVFHTASPLALVVDDPQRDLLDPAVKGTRNVLETASATESVGRVVVTSSVAAIVGDNADIASLPGGVITEESWNSSSSPSHLPYSHSKALAERAAWENAEAQSRWRLVTVNPGMVIGPAASELAPECLSFSLMKQFGDGTLKAGAPPFELGIVRRAGCGRGAPAGRVHRTSGRPAPGVLGPSELAGDRRRASREVRGVSGPSLGANCRSGWCGWWARSWTGP